ncbi:MAG TPA: hypothetical protein VI791_01420 [Patescibacteria group bacterium]|nr:hypothetical protein [Patescibacteria group bacterium]
MKTKSAIFLAVSALFLAACNYTGPAATTTTPPAAATPTTTVSVAPTTGSTNVNDLNTELNATVDDGGQADLNQLQKDAAGL